MASLKIRIRRSRVNKNGESPLFIQIFSGSTKKEVSLGLSVQANDWDDLRNIVKRKNPRHGQLNSIIRTRLAELQDQIDILQRSKRYFSAQEILDNYKAAIRKAKPNFNVITEFLGDYIERNPNNMRLNSFHTYRNLIACLNKFKPNLTFEELNLDLVKSYEKYLLKEGKAINTISDRMKILRRSITLANEAGILQGNPMKGYKRKHEESKREFISIGELKQYEAYKASTKGRQKVVDMFLFNCYTGLRIGDLFTILKSDIIQDDDTIRLRLRMNKNTSLVSHKLNDKAIVIFNKYYSNESKYIFNILNEELNLDNQVILDKEINKRNSYFNKVIKEVTQKLGIDKKVSFHVARHTFATISISMGIPIEVVGKLLGHKNIRETQIYAKVTNPTKDKAIDLWNKL